MHAILTLLALFGVTHAASNVATEGPSFAERLLEPQRQVDQVHQDDFLCKENGSMTKDVLSHSSSNVICHQPNKPGFGLGVATVLSIFCKILRRFKIL